jgi:integrase/recombinase XerD
MSETPISPLRRRMIEDMSLRNFGEKTHYDYIRHVKAFSTFLGRSPASATGEDLRRYRVHQSQTVSHRRPSTARLPRCGSSSG